MYARMACVFNRERKIEILVVYTRCPPPAKDDESCVDFRFAYIYFNKSQHSHTGYFYKSGQCSVWCTAKERILYCAEIFLGLRIVLFLEIKVVIFEVLAGGYNGHLKKE